MSKVESGTELINKRDQSVWNTGAGSIIFTENGAERGLQITHATGDNLNFTNKMLRPSQINNSSGYGVGLNINRIVSLNLENFQEILIKTIHPNKKTNATGLHHISNTQSKVVVDVREKLYIKQKN